MTAKRGAITFRRGVDRLFESVDQFTIQQAMFSIGALWASGALGGGIGHDDCTSIDSMAFPLSLDIPLAGVAETAFAEKPVNSRTLVIHEATRADKMPADAPFSQGLNHVLWLPITLVFISFFEGIRPWMDQKYPPSAGQKAWPPTLFFARQIRNAAAHNGQVHFLKDIGRTAGWHHLKIAFSDNGKAALGPNGFMSPADLMFLMIDASDELDQIGCPIR